ncbi:MAG: hypothetical protein AABX13_05110 [Nanoarchaeota archaeon]
MVVLDSSSLILLAKTGLLDLFLAQLKESPVIPSAVYEEGVKAKRADDAFLIKERVKDERILIHQLSDHILSNKLKHDFNLGLGEAEAIALCLQNKAVLITDDKKAISTCKILGIEFVTVPNIVVELYRRKIIQKQEAEVVVKKLQLYGRYSVKIMEKIKEDLL